MLCSPVFVLKAARAVDRSIRVTGAEKATQLRMLNFLETDDYFNELWDEERWRLLRLRVPGACGEGCLIAISRRSGSRLHRIWQG